MAELAWTEVSDVRDRWMGDDPLTATHPHNTTLLVDAVDPVLRVFPDLATRIARADGSDLTDGPSTPLGRVKKVIARMVIRHLRNPKGIRQTQEGAGPFQRSQTYGGEEPGAIILTEDDRDELTGRTTGPLGAFTIDTIPASSLAAGPSTWLELGRTWR